MIGRDFSNRVRAFTLIELLVVLAIVSLLLTLASPRYFQSIDKTKEAVLAENLRLTRETIDKFYGDRGRYPESLNELVDEGYLRNLPYDPVADSDSSWIVVAPKEGRVGGVYDLKSTADGQALNGRAFKDF